MIFHPQKEAQLPLAVLFPLNTKFQFQSIECKAYKQAKKKKKICNEPLVKGVAKK